MAGRADVLAPIEFRAGKGKMKHPGTFNANPLSAAAGVAALQEVASGEPCRRANASAKELRQRLNTLFEERGVRWVAYGDFSALRLLADYEGPRPRGEALPYDELTS